MMDNVYEFQDPYAIEEAAATWLIKLEGDSRPSAEELGEFREWIAQSTEHQEAFKQISTFWEEDEVLAELAIPLTPPARKRHQYFKSLFNLPWSLGRVGAIASVLAVGIYLTLGSGLFKFNSSLNNNIYLTEVGEQQTYTLADGSVLLLNTDTQVQVEYSDAFRKILLLQGEAHFDVVADTSRPFEVYAGDGMVRAVGTAFSVFLDDDAVEVIVNEGKVDLSAVSNLDPMPDGPQSISGNALAQANMPKLLGSLAAGQSAVFSQSIDEVYSLAELELAKELSWRSGLLIFKGDPLSEVVKEINRYTPLTIKIVDPALNHLEIGGRFKVDEIDGIFDVLEANFGIQVSRISGQNIQLHSAKK